MTTATNNDIDLSDRNADTPDRYLTRNEYAKMRYEVQKVIIPVSFAIGATVFLIELLREDDDEDEFSREQSQSMVESAYAEKSSDTVYEKLIGSVENAVVFVLFVTVMTFGLYWLFKNKFSRAIWAYMAVSGFSIFAVLGASIANEVFRKYHVTIDVISFMFWTWNVTALGVTSVFLWPGSLLVKQAYLVLISVIVAYYFTQIPEWTTWTMLIFMALYDLYAVLTPNGPLRKIVELSQEREEEIPALVYEARGSGGKRRRRRSSLRIIEQQQQQTIAASETSTSTLVANENERLDGDYLSSSPERQQKTQTQRRKGASEKTSLLEKIGLKASTTSSSTSTNENAPLIERFEEEGDEREYQELPDGIKLGLGDFIFYSVLVGRAAMQSLFCAIFCYVAVISGLIITLAGLAMHKAALPALPVSIALGVITFVVVKFLVEPIIVSQFAVYESDTFNEAALGSTKLAARYSFAHYQLLR